MLKRESDEKEGVLSTLKNCWTGREEDNGDSTSSTFLVIVIIQKDVQMMMSNLEWYPLKQNLS